MKYASSSSAWWKTYNGSKKRDLPWTMWSDGKWRCMEPDGLLPCFGLHLLRNNYKPVMLHEGAKTALMVQAMLA